MMGKCKTEGSSKVKTIEISAETYGKLCGIRTALEGIFNGNVTFDQTLKILLSPKLFDYQELFTNADNKT